MIELTGHEDRRNPLVTAILAFARTMSDGELPSLEPEASGELSV